MSWARPAGRRYGFDILIAAAAAEGALEVAFHQDTTRAPQTTLWFSVPAVVAFFAPLLARRRFAFAAPAAAWLIGAALSFVDGRLVVFASGVYIGGMGAAFLLGNLPDEFRGRLGLVVVAACAAIIAYNDPSRSGGELVFIPVIFSICWLVGHALRARSEQAEAAEARAAQAEREREAAARLAVAEERARITRELHDIVAHAVSVMVLQVGAVRHELPDGLAHEKQALNDVERAGRTALAEMRRLLGAMRRDDDDVELAPQPGLAMLDALLDEVRRTGLEVGMHVEGEPVALSSALDLTAYRIIQEGLTNVRKHAGAARADVTVRYGVGELEIEVRDDGRGGAAGDGSGHGLVGVRERVKIYGGEMHAGTENGRGFVLNARLPTGAARR